jgi:anti-sigma factor RsiW
MHVAGCAECRAAVEQERAIRQLLARSADALREQAPVSLRDRVTRVTLPRPSWTAWRPWSRPVAAALLLGAVGAAVFGVLAPSGALLATELAVDHAKCRFLSQTTPGVAPGQLEAEWQQRHGWDLQVPPSAPEHHLVLMGVRRCFFHGGTVAHLRYDVDGRDVSLYVFDGSRQGAPDLAIMGLQTTFWSSGARTFAVVGDVPAPEFPQLVEYFKQRVGN